MVAVVGNPRTRGNAADGLILAAPVCFTNEALCRSRSSASHLGAAAACEAL